MDTASVVPPYALDYSAAMAEPKTERVVLYVSPSMKELIRILAAERFALDGGASVSQFGNEVFEEWIERHPDEVRAAQRRIRELKKKRKP